MNLILLLAKIAELVHSVYVPLFFFQFIYSAITKQIADKTQNIFFGS